jgi:2-keto-4-pentenoate hydratase/2-oxohepta-3-ene-1,7-dioic acid hydratase in catechol pathway
MKLCRFRIGSDAMYGIVEDDIIYGCTNSLQKTARSFRTLDIDLQPIVEPSKIVCVGRNYSDHALELGNQVPAEPLLFLKAPSAVNYHGNPIVLPEASNDVQFEGELAVIIGSKCSHLTELDDPFDFVLGYSCLNDVTARDLQRKDVQFTRAKSFDTFCPVGPFIETELDVTDIAVTTSVNGTVRQSGRTSEMTFPIGDLIRYISQQMTLWAGDVIATGTPAGVGTLKAGDICEVSIEGIGTLMNPVV